MAVKLSTTTKKIFTSTIWQLIGKFFSMTITVGATMAIARIYGRESYGEFNLMQSWPALVFIVVDFGLNAIAVRESVKEQHLLEEYYSNVLLLRALLSAILIAIMGIALYFFPYSSSLKFGIFISLPLILTQGLFATANIVYQSKMCYDLSVISNSIGYIFILFALFVLAALRVSVIWISFSYVIGGLITFFVNLWFVKRLGINLRFSPNSKIVNNLVLESLPLGLMFVFSQLNFKSDSILMSVLPMPKYLGLTNNEAVAIYGLPYKIFEVGLVVPTFFMNSVYPVFVRHLKESKTKFLYTFKQTIGFLILAAVLCSFMGVLLSPLVISILGGKDFATSILVMQILFGGLIFYFLTQPISWVIVTLGKQKYLPIIYFISAVFNISANYIFIPKYAFFASAVITHASEFLILLLLLLFFRKSWKEYHA